MSKRAVTGATVFAAELAKEAGSSGLAGALGSLGSDLMRCEGTKQAVALLGGLVGGPLLWATVLVGGCILDHQGKRRGEEEARIAFQTLGRRLAELERAVSDQRDFVGLLDELLQQNSQFKGVFQSSIEEMRVQTTRIAEGLRMDRLVMDRFHREVGAYFSWITNTLQAMHGTQQEIYVAVLSIQCDLASRIAAKDDEIRTLSSAVREALERALLAEVSRGRALREVVGELGHSDPAQLVKLLDDDAARGRLARAENAQRARDRAVLYLVLGEVAKSEQSAREATGLDPDDARTWTTLARVLDTSGRDYEATLALREATNRSSPGTRVHAIAHYGLGVLSIKPKEYAQARASFTVALEHGRQVGDQVLRLQSAAYLAYVLDLTDQEDEAIELLLEAIDVSEQLGDTAEAAECCCHLGMVYETSGELERSESMYRKSLEHGIRDNDVPRIGNEYLNVGRMCFRRERFAEANEAFSRAIPFLMKTNHDGKVAWAHKYLACIADRLSRSAATTGQWSEAARWAADEEANWRAAGDTEQAAAAAKWREDIEGYIGRNDANAGGAGQGSQ